jgi:hypothetical protein
LHLGQKESASDTVRLMRDRTMCSQLHSWGVTLELMYTDLDGGKLQKSGLVLPILVLT